MIEDAAGGFFHAEDGCWHNEDCRCKPCRMAWGEMRSMSRHWQSEPLEPDVAPTEWCEPEPPKRPAVRSWQRRPKPEHSTAVENSSKPPWRSPEIWWKDKIPPPVIRDDSNKVILVVPCAGPQITLQSERYDNGAS